MRLSAQETRTGQAQLVTRLEEEEEIILQEAEKVSEKSPRQHELTTLICRGCLFISHILLSNNQLFNPKPQYTQYEYIVAEELLCCKS